MKEETKEKRDQKEKKETEAMKVKEEIKVKKDQKEKREKKEIKENKDNKVRMGSPDLWDQLVKMHLKLHFMKFMKLHGQQRQKLEW